jgi:hypothetical protein
VETGPAADNGQGQSQGHRRRRRRRKNKSGQQNPAAAQTAQPQQAPPQPAPPPQPQPQARKPQQQNRQNTPKKKFFKKASAAPGQPGNGSSQPQQNKRKPRQKAAREFVGPMDHSYRVVNGNVADGQSSTMPMNSASRLTHWEEPYMAPAPIREDAPARIYCFIEDLFFTAKIQDASRKLGVKVEFIKGDKESVTRLLELPEAERPALLVFDINNANAKPITLIPKLRTKFKKTVSIVGFLSHLQGDLKAKASEAGCDTVMPRSAFSQALPNMLRRYGIEEDEDAFQQPV